MQSQIKQWWTHKLIYSKSKINTNHTKNKIEKRKQTIHHLHHTIQYKILIMIRMGTLK